MSFSGQRLQGVARGWSRLCWVGFLAFLAWGEPPSSLAPESGLPPMIVKPEELPELLDRSCGTRKSAREKNAMGYRANFRSRLA
jgi:hypothetical protein